ncbi:hypothetical protein [Candidatus Nitrotoga sp. AM1P]|uniref:hypothetical protein n=1 Tax=Candidatus Nitrotoga sp. AM1P TaxID=2559597 RepID=UPI0010AFA861|nr:hypothetical protein [Candidatus Nitrotoga sp. AM1P]BBJ24083.1 hypothetical protein W01_20100 [Candidatus Nitrotoga sp. AM1P]
MKNVHAADYLQQDLDTAQTIISDVLVANTKNGNSTSKDWETLSVAKLKANNCV